MWQWCSVERLPAQKHIRLALYDLCVPLYPFLERGMQRPMLPGIVHCCHICNISHDLREALWLAPEPVEFVCWLLNGEGSHHLKCALWRPDFVALAAIDSTD